MYFEIDSKEDIEVADDTLQLSIFNNYIKSPCGYCRRHHGVLSVQQMKKKQCLQKQCHHLEKYEDHEYWEKRAEKKKKRLERKKYLDTYI